MATDTSLVSGMPGRYASALFELAEADGALDTVAAHLQTFKQALGESADLRRLVKSPVFGADEQTTALSAVLNHLGLSGLASNLVLLMAKNRRLFAVDAMIDAFTALLARHRGQVDAHVTTATALTPEQEEALRASLKQSTGSDVQLNITVDPTILGGLVVRVGSRMVDSSLETKLNNLRIAMKEVG